METEKTVTLTLTLTEIRNFIAFGNRAEMRGSEADTWVALKQTIAAAVAKANAERDDERQSLNVVKTD